MKPIKFNHSASDVAKWFLQRNFVQMEAEDAEYISNLKLQKLFSYRPYRSWRWRFGKNHNRR